MDIDLILEVVDTKNPPSADIRLDTLVTHTYAFYDALHPFHLHDFV